MAWPKGRKRSAADKLAISEGLRLGPKPHNICYCGLECLSSVARYCSNECRYADPAYREQCRRIAKQVAKNLEWRKKCLGPTGARTRYGCGAEPSPTMLEYAVILCPLGYEMDKVTISLPIGHGRYILDFALLSAKINIEIDGKTHLDRVESDQRRDTYLRSLGWKVIRIRI